MELLLNAFVVGVFIGIALLVVWVGVGVLFQVGPEWPADALRAVRRKRADKRAGIVPIPDDLSEVSQQLIREFRALPVDNRPYAESELVRVLRALDVAAPNVDNMVSSYGYVSWTGPHTKAPEHRPYVEIHHAIETVQQAIRAQQRALALAGVASDLSRVSEITDALRQESAIVKKVTEELV